MTSIPTGTILIYSLITLPSGYLTCDGSAISRSIYLDLYNVIGTKYGFGDGITTFNLPNFSNRAPVQGNSLAETGGSNSITIQTTNLPEHTHNPTFSADTHKHELNYEYQEQTYDSFYYLQNLTTGGDNDSDIQNGIDPAAEVLSLPATTSEARLTIENSTNSYGPSTSINIQNSQISLNYIIKY